MSRPLIYALYTALLVAPSSPKHVKSTMPKPPDNFAKAVAGAGSSAPPYALVTIINDDVKTRQTVCVNVNSVVLAIKIQYRLPDTLGSREAARKIALANKTQIFHLSDPKALAIVQPRYSPEVLAQVRTYLSKMSTPDLLRGTVHGTLGIGRLKGYQWQTYRDALAYVLLERGLYAVEDDITGDVIVRPNDAQYRYLRTSAANQKSRG